MTYADAFPDFPAAEMPPIPPAWVDISWRGARFADACPQFVAAGALDAPRVVVTINWQDRCGCGDAYLVTLWDGEEEHVDDFGTDDWEAVLPMVDEFAAKLAAMVAAAPVFHVFAGGRYTVEPRKLSHLRRGDSLDVVETLATLAEARAYGLALLGPLGHAHWVLIVEASRDAIVRDLPEPVLRMRQSASGGIVEEA